MARAVILTVALSKDESERFEEAKSLSGIRSNSEFVRLAIQNYLETKK